MSEDLQNHELEELMLDLEADQIEALYGNRIRGEVRVAFESYKATCALLTALPETLAQQIRPMPELSAKPVIPFPARRVSMPLWSLPFAAAALVALGLLVPRKQEAGLPEVDLTQSRHAQVLEMPELDYEIMEAFVQRAQALQSRREFNRAWDDYERALFYVPMDQTQQRRLVLEEMQILAEELGDTVKKERVEQLKSLVP